MVTVRFESDIETYVCVLFENHTHTIKHAMLLKKITIEGYV